MGMQNKAGDWNQSLLELAGCWGKDLLLGDSQEQQNQLAGASPSPSPSLADSLQYPLPLTEPDMEPVGRAGMWFSETQLQHHKEERRVCLVLRYQSLMARTH